MFLAVTGYAGTDDVVQRMRSTFAEGLNVVLSKRVFASFPAVVAAMILCRLNFKPLGMRKIIDGGSRYTGIAISSRGAPYVWMSLTIEFIRNGQGGFIGLIIVPMIGKNCLCMRTMILALIRYFRFPIGIIMRSAPSTCLFGPVCKQGRIFVTQGMITGSRPLAYFVAIFPFLGTVQFSTSFRMRFAPGSRVRSFLLRMRFAPRFPIGTVIRTFCFRIFVGHLNLRSGYAV